MNMRIRTLVARIANPAARRRVAQVARGAALAAAFVALAGFVVREQAAPATAVRASAPARLAARGLAVGPDGTLFITVQGAAPSAGGLAVLDTGTGSLQLLQSGLRAPGYPSVDAAGRVVWPDSASGRMLVEARPGTAPAVLPAALDAPGSVAAGGRGRLYFTSAGSAVGVVDGARTTVLRSGEPAPADVAVSASGALFWTGTAAGVIMRLGTDGTTQVVASGLNAPMGLGLSADGSTLYFTEVPTPGLTAAQGGHNLVRAVDLASGQVRTVAQGGADPFDVAATAGGRVYWTSSASSTLVVSAQDDEGGDDPEDAGQLVAQAVLTGGAEVPPVDTAASGRVTFSLATAPDDDGDEGAGDVSQATTVTTQDQEHERRVRSRIRGRSEHREGEGRPTPTPGPTPPPAPSQGVLRYDVQIRGIDGVTGGAIYRGQAGDTGDMVAALKLTPGGGESWHASSKNKVVGHGLLGPDSLAGGPFEGDWQGFMDALDAGDLYVNVSTNTHPDGEIRGQLVPSGGVPANSAPNAEITSPAGDVQVQPGEPVAFAGTASDPDGDMVAVLWAFGDGSTSTDLVPGDHSYAAAGTYTVTLTATDSQGLSDPTPATRTITVVAGGNQAPDGTITQPAGNVSIAPGDPVTFAGTASDPDGDTVTVLWDFGDGATSTSLSPGAHVYAAAGIYTVTFTATDSQGLADPTPDTRTVTVTAGSANNPPNGTITQPAGNVTINAGGSVTFAGTASDPDGDAVTVLWDFGDGSTSTALSPGAHTYAIAGTYTVTFTATDSQGLADPSPASRIITVTAANNPPNATIVQPAGNVTIDAGQSVTFAGIASDPDGDAVTVVWSFGDGATSTALSPGGHVYANVGTYTVTLTATDSKGLADPSPASRTITVNAASTAPTFASIQSTIFTPSCIGCHSGSNPPAGLNLSAGQSFANLVNVPSTSNPSILRVAPGNPDNSYLVIQLQSGHRSRPQSDIDMIRAWILAGAPNN